MITVWGKGNDLHQDLTIKPGEFADKYQKQIGLRIKETTKSFLEERALHGIYDLCASYYYHGRYHPNTVENFKFACEHGSNKSMLLCLYIMNHFNEDMETYGIYFFSRGGSVTLKDAMKYVNSSQKILLLNEYLKAIESSELNSEQWESDEPRTRSREWLEGQIDMLRECHYRWIDTVSKFNNNR